MCASVAAVSYARVSTDELARGDSCEHQHKSNAMLAADRGWQVIAQLSDEGVSGATLQRPAWQKAVGLITGKQASVIIVRTWDRVSRDLVEYRVFESEILKPAGGSIQPVIGVASDNTDPAAWLAQTQELAFAEYFRRLTSWKTQQGMRRKAEQGLFLYVPPFGYRPSERKGIPVADAEQWPVLLEIFTRAAAGDSDGSIRRWLQSQHVKPRRTNWGLSTIRQIISNPYYKGEIHCQGEVFASQHVERVPVDLWESAQRQYRPRDYGGRPPRGEYIYLLPRVVCSHYRVTTKGIHQGGPLPLYARWVMGRGGKKYYYYSRADRIRGGDSGLSAVTADDTALDWLPSSVDAVWLDQFVVNCFAQYTRADSRFWDDLQSAADAECDMLAEHRAHLERMISRTRREREQAEERGLKALLDTGLTEITRKLNSKIAELRADEERMCGEVAELGRYIASLAQPVVAARELSHILDGALDDAYKSPVVAYELRGLLGDYIEYVDLRRDYPAIHIRPGMLINHDLALFAQLAEPPAGAAAVACFVQPNVKRPRQDSNL